MVNIEFFKNFILGAALLSSVVVFASEKVQKVSKTKEQIEQQIKQIKEKIQLLNNKKKADEEHTSENKEQLNKLRNEMVELLREKMSLTTQQFLGSSEGKKSETKEGCCSLCLEEMKKEDNNKFDLCTPTDTEGNELPKHSFHKECLINFFIKTPVTSYKCPQCRKGVAGDTFKPLLSGYLNKKEAPVSPELFLALCRAGFTDLVQTCLERNHTLINCYEQEIEITPLHEAVHGQRWELALELLKHGARTNVYDVTWTRPYDLLPCEKNDEDGNLKKLRAALQPKWFERWNHNVIYVSTNFLLSHNATNMEHQLFAFGAESLGYTYSTLFFRPKSWHVFQEMFFGSALRTLFTTATLVGLAAYLGTQTTSGCFMLHRLAPAYFKNPYDQMILLDGNYYSRDEFARIFFSRIQAGLRLGADARRAA